MTPHQRLAMVKVMAARCERCGPYADWLRLDAEPKRQLVEAHDAWVMATGGNARPLPWRMTYAWADAVILHSDCDGGRIHLITIPDGWSDDGE